MSPPAVAPTSVAIGGTGQAFDSEEVEGVSGKNEYGLSLIFGGSSGGSWTSCT